MVQGMAQGVSFECLQSPALVNHIPHHFSVYALGAFLFELVLQFGNEELLVAYSAG